MIDGVPQRVLVADGPNVVLVRLGPFDVDDRLVRVREAQDWPAALQGLYVATTNDPLELPGLLIHKDELADPEQEEVSRKWSVSTSS